MDPRHAAHPDGYLTDVSERGRSLSSGERQLIALARARLVDPAILLLDEATSNLDLASEAKVQRAMARVADGRTTLLIAHRLPTARTADRIAFVADYLPRKCGIATFTSDLLLAVGAEYPESTCIAVPHGTEVIRSVRKRIFCNGPKPLSPRPWSSALPSAVTESSSPLPPLMPWHMASMPPIECPMK